ncbi:PfWMP3_03 [Phormidium phage Pf-WMP3]|uniref:PfWMP3_03 n=1 Tax=Phormidium phage Pf-WMP3 TaxID=2914005 RepID=A5HL54_9CAUD|nr:PfWMP3_03 [Phormidium phage Pf-WMP3]ABQ12443.1 PfWMP3_03 [Phormidium phage Pf-WMP3]
MGTQSNSNESVGSTRDTKDPQYPHLDRYEDHSETIKEVLKEKGYSDEEAEQFLDDATTDTLGRNRRT